MLAAAGMMASGLGLGALGTMFGSNGAKKQLKLMQDALDYQKGIDKRTYNDLGAYRKFGGEQLNALTGFLNDKNPEDYIDPGYDFRMKSGTNAIMNNAATRGMAQSGDTLRALEQFGQDMGSQEYGNAFNRFLGEGQFRQGLTGIGQNAATTGGQLANQGSQIGAQITQNMDAGASDRMWGEYLGGIGGMGTQMGMAGMGGPKGVMNSFSNIFKSGQTPARQYNADWG